MKTVVTTLRDMLILGVLGAGIALGVNAVRAKGSVDLTKAYFVQASPKKTVTKPPKATPSDPPVQTVAKEVPPSTAPLEASNGASKQPTDSEESLYQRITSVPDRPMEHGFKAVTFDEAVAIFDDPGTQMGANVFVDARNDTAFDEGHIPGAWQAYHYEIERYIDVVMPIVQSADIVVVYCNGGDCEDSGLVCADLNEAGVDYDRLYLFKDGWEAWTAKNMPIETGRSIGIGDE